MKRSIMTILILAMAITLSSCGGGGGGATGGNPGTGSTSLSLTISPVETSLPANTLGYPAFIGSPFLTQVDVRVTFENGQGVATGTIVHLQTNDVEIASVATADDPETTDLNEFSDLFSGLNQETIGSIATFYIKSGFKLGTASITANATHPTTGRNFSKILNFNVTSGPDPDFRQISVGLTKTTIPVNASSAGFYEGTPYLLEADIQFRNIFGNLTNPEIGDNGKPVVSVSISPTSVLKFSKLDDADTEDVDEFLEQKGQGTVNIVAGHGVLYLWSQATIGPATVTVSAVEAGSGRRLTTSFNINVVQDNTGPPVEQLSIVVPRSTIPVNSLEIPFYSGTPYMIEADIQFRDAAGNLANPALNNDDPAIPVVNVSISPSNILKFSKLDNAETDDVNEFTSLVSQGFVRINSGHGTLFLWSQNTTGIATVTLSAKDAVTNRDITSTFDIEIIPDNNPIVQQLIVVRPKDTIPVNTESIPFYNGTPYLIEADIQFRDATGNFTNPEVNDDGVPIVNISINQPSILKFSRFDDLRTTNINEFQNQVGQGIVTMNSGHGTLFLWSQNVLGVATVTVSAKEAGSDRILATTFNIEIIEDDNDIEDQLITVLPKTTIPVNADDLPFFNGTPYLIETEIQFRDAQGNLINPVADLRGNSVVDISVNPSSILQFSGLDNPTTSVDEFLELRGQGNISMNSGRGSLFLWSKNVLGTATVTVSAVEPESNRLITTSFDIEVVEDPNPPIEQLIVVRPRNTLPVDTQNTAYFNGSPFVMETDVQFRDLEGNLVNPQVNQNVSLVNVSISPTSVLKFSTIDDPATEDVDEFLNLLGQGSIQMNSGHGSLYLWSSDLPGVATVTLSAIEEGSGRVITTSFEIEVVDDGSNPGIPSSVSINNATVPLYVNGSSGVTSQTATITVLAGNVPVLDPEVHNVILSIVTDGLNSGEKITGTDIDGNEVSGTSIDVTTVNGIVNAIISSGTNPNSITLSATVDRADNNVDNGLQDALTTTREYTVSDGKLWALELTSPALDALTVNGETDNQGVINFQDGTYSLVISAIATDKGGNPALPQTLEFGLINSPITGYPENGSGSFVISGSNGDPQEGGNIFTSQNGGFITAAGGVQPGDTLVVFGEESLGNEDLESAVTVGSVSSQSSLTIVETFNRNDSTGSVNNDFGILPYAIGRSVDGNINATATINANGVATTRINYPVSQLGRIAAVFVKGQGVIVNGIPKVVTDVEITAFPGIEGFNNQSSTLIVSPNIIPGNIDNISFTVCIADSARNPLPGRTISFSYAGGTGQGTIDGQLGSGILNNVTGSNGCANGLASTSGLIPGADTNDLGFDFFAGSITCNAEDSQSARCMTVVPPTNAVLNANPSAFIGRGDVNITLSLFDGSGQPIEGASISGTCDQVDGGNLAITSGPTVTNSSGRSSVSVIVALDGINEVLNGTCTFATATGDPSTTVNFTGDDACALMNVGILPSPLPPPNACMPTQFTVSGNLTGLTSAGPVILSNNGFNVTLNANSSFSFPQQNDNSVYNISVTTQPLGQVCTVANGSGTISGADVTNVTVTCI